MRQRLAHLFRRLADKLDPPPVPQVTVTWTSWSSGWGTNQPYPPTITYQ
jgi:hypothetical protein